MDKNLSNYVPLHLEFNFGLHSRVERGSNFLDPSLTQAKDGPGPYPTLRVWWKGRVTIARVLQMQWKTKRDFSL